ncbi:hypothetical protein ACSW8S_19645 (plasmid) [Clostridium perfringens]
MGIKIEYGFKNDILVHISEVEKGLDCGCSCPCCGSLLVAKKGAKVSHHFTHYNRNECEGAYETILHMLAKEILSENNCIVGPEIMIGPNDMLTDRSLIHYDDVILEKKIGNIVPDVVLYKAGRPMIVEIFVTHNVDLVKREKINKLGISVLEVNLSKISRGITKDELESILLYKSECKAWIYNKPLDDFIKKQSENLISLCSNYRVFKGEKFWMSDYILECPLEKRRNWKTNVYNHNDGTGCVCCVYFQGYSYSKQLIATCYKKDYLYEDEHGLFDEDGCYYDFSMDKENKGYYHLYNEEVDGIYCGYKYRIIDYSSYKKALKRKV